ncbi:MAG: alpha/beta hydrolase fold domain-containing protein [Bacteroidia bacterium]|nr:alpha/beta hydrolase fold domain-containing protein [Bacteroidia bacterium]
MIRFLVCLTMFFPFYLSAQPTCATGRYQQVVFPSVTKISGVKYGWNVQPELGNPNNVDTLYMDIYMPAGDSPSVRRPVILLAFGGSFFFGSRTSPDVVELCNRFAKLGYVTVSIDYRLTPDLVLNGSAYTLYLAVTKASHDMRGAVRFLHKDAMTEDKYRINPDQIFIGGVSAGAIAAIHLAYLDEASEYPSVIAGSLPAIGGVEGLSGSMGYPSRVAGVINLCGAIGDTTWIHPGDEPIVSMHGTQDGTVPYGSSTLQLFSVNLLVHGSASIDKKAENAGIHHAFYSFVGADHTPFVLGTSAPQYMDTTFWYVRDFLAGIVCENATSIDHEKLPPALVVAPHPFSSTTRISLENHLLKNLELWDIQGRRMEIHFSRQNESLLLERGSLTPGLYIVRVQDETGAWAAKKVWVE